MMEREGKRKKGERGEKKRFPTTFYRVKGNGGRLLPLLPWRGEKEGERKPTIKRRCNLISRQPKGGGWKTAELFRLR